MYRFMIFLWLVALPAFACSIVGPRVTPPLQLKLNQAVIGNQVAAARHWLKAGADVNFRTLPWGLTPLMLSVRGPLPMTRFLIRSGADVNLPDRAGKTVLMRAIFRGNLPLTRLLIASGADVNEVGEQSKTPVFYAVITGRPAFVRLLLAHGARLNVRDDFGNTPLSLATRMVAAARAITPIESMAVMTMRHDDSMIMRTRAQAIHDSVRTLALLRAAGATLGQQPPRADAYEAACRFFVRPHARHAPGDETLAARR